MVDGIAMVEVLLGLPGMRVLGVAEGDSDVFIELETTASMGWCRSCGVRAQAQDRTVKSVVDLSCFGRPVRLEIGQRRWRCRESSCAVKTWTEDMSSTA